MRSYAIPRRSFTLAIAGVMAFGSHARIAEGQNKPPYFYCEAFDHVHHVVYLSGVLQEPSSDDDTMFLADAGFAFGDYLHDKYGADFSGGGGTDCFSKATRREAHDEIDKDITEFNNAASKTVLVSNWTYEQKQK